MTFSFCCHPELRALGAGGGGGGGGGGGEGVAAHQKLRMEERKRNRENGVNDIHHVVGIRIQSRGCKKEEV